MTSIDDITNGVKANEDFLEPKVDPYERYRVLCEEFKEKYGYIGKDKGYHLAIGYDGADKIFVDVHDRRWIRLFKEKSFEKIKTLFPTEFVITNGEESKTYTVEVSRVISSKFL